MALIHTATGYAHITKPPRMFWVYCPHEKDGKKCNRKLFRASGGSRVEVICTRCKMKYLAIVSGEGVVSIDTVP